MSDKAIAFQARSRSVAYVAAHKAPWTAVQSGSPSADMRKGPV